MIKVSTIKADRKEGQAEFDKCEKQKDQKDNNTERG